MSSNVASWKILYFYATFKWDNHLFNEWFSIAIFDYRRVALTCFISTPSVDVPNFNLLKGRMKLLYLLHPIPMMLNTHQMAMGHNFLDPKGSSFLCMNSDFALYLWSVSLGRTITQMVSTNRNQPGNQLATHSIAWACHTSFNRIPFLNQQKNNWPGFNCCWRMLIPDDPRWSTDQPPPNLCEPNDLGLIWVLRCWFYMVFYPILTKDDPSLLGYWTILDLYTHVKHMGQSQIFRRGPWSTPHVRHPLMPHRWARWLRGIWPPNKDEGYHFQKWRYIHITWTKTLISPESKQIFWWKNGPQMWLSPTTTVDFSNKNWDGSYSQR